MPKYNWSTYNSLRTKLSSKFIRFNNSNKVNYSEASYYNHTRDIFCLTLLFNKKANRKTKILDYGSNLLALSNIKSKINEKLFSFSIYDPFYLKKYQKIKKPFKIKLITRKEELKIKKFDIINFGSCLQYIDDLRSLKNHLNFKLVDTVSITATPISLIKEYKLKQKNHKNLIQNIHSLEKIKKYFKKMGFNLIFKSAMDSKYIASQKKIKNIYSLNLIFSKKNNLLS